VIVYRKRVKADRGKCARNYLVWIYGKSAFPHISLSIALTIFKGEHKRVAAPLPLLRFQREKLYLFADLPPPPPTPQVRPIYVQGPR
jgi:hypothetical protein